MDEEEVLSTDNEILNNIGEGDEPSSDEGVTSQENGTSEAPKESAPTTSGEQGTNTGANGEQQQQTRGPQDLVGRDGQVVAKGGAERRHYEAAQREKHRADTAQQENSKLTTQLKAINDAGTVGTQYNLTPEEVTTGAQMISAWKDDPVNTLKYMLTQAAALGHNVEGLQQGGTDMSAVKQMITDSLAPLMEGKQLEKDTQENEVRAREVYTDFISRHQDASVHEDTLAQLLQKDQNLNVESAYYKLQAFYANNGYDWTKSLATLQQEYEAKAPQNTQVPQPPDGGGVSNTQVTDSANVASVNESTSDIIKQAIADAGIR